MITNHNVITGLYFKNLKTVIKLGILSILSDFYLDFCLNYLTC